MCEWHPTRLFTPDNHPQYCRDALRLLLKECPSIAGITFRAHSESGIPDGSHGFWETVFQGVADCGRRVEIDLHAKGIDFEQIQMALDTGQPVGQVSGRRAMPTERRQDPARVG